MIISFRDFLFEDRYFFPYVDDRGIFQYQDRQQGYIINQPWVEDTEYKTILKYANDIFRELTQSKPSWVKIKEAEESISEFIKQKPNTIFQQNHARNFKFMKRLYNFWERQPYNKDIQKTTIEINKALLKGKWGEVADNLEELSRMRSYNLHM